MSSPEDAVGPVYTLEAGVFTAEWPSPKVTLTVSRLREERHGQALPGQVSLRIHGGPEYDFGSNNTNSPQTRKGLAKDLDERWPLEGTAAVGWLYIIQESFSNLGKLWWAGEPALPLRFSKDGDTGISWLLEPFIALHHPTLLFGEGETGKSMTALAIALQVQNGYIPEGMPWTSVDPRPVLYLDWELDREVTEKRATALAKGLGLPYPELPLYRRCYASLPDDTSDIRRMVRDNDVGLVIVDSIGPASGDDLKDDKTAFRFYEALRLMGCASLLIGHLSKEESRRKGKRTPYGNIYFWNLTRLAWEVRRQEDLTDHVMGFMLSKNNLTQERYKSFGLSIIGEDGVIRLESQDYREAMPELMQRGDAVKELLGREGAQSNAQISDYLELSKQRVNNLLTQLRKKGEIQVLPNHRYGLPDREPNRVQ